MNKLKICLIVIGSILLVAIIVLCILLATGALSGIVAPIM